MGEEITTSKFTAEDFGRFSARLRDETALLKTWIDEGRLSDEGLSWGFELEAWLVDHNCFPAPVNEAFLRAVDHPYVVPELSRFNVELNASVQPVTGRCFRAAEDELRELWAHCNAIAHSLDANMVAVGALPTVRRADLSLANLSPSKRFYALNHEILSKRKGQPVVIDIDGREHLFARHRNVMMESAATSFQLHLKTPISEVHRYYNASVMLAGPVLACCVNSPVLFGHILWDETRIPLFEQSVAQLADDPHWQRVTIGDRYVDTSIFECFEDNLRHFGILLPAEFGDSSDMLHHLRFHNGTIWRWVRPLIGFDESGSVHTRIEFRVLPAGPSFADMFANAALYLGLVHHWVRNDLDRDTSMPFEHARYNFYQAARHGLDADLTWRGNVLPVTAIVNDELIDQARHGLTDLGVDGSDITRAMDVIAARVQSRQTGAAWQRDYYLRNERDASKLMAAYCENQRSGAPVHEWPRHTTP